MTGFYGATNVRCVQQTDKNITTYQRCHSTTVITLKLKAHQAGYTYNIALIQSLNTPNLTLQHHHRTENIRLQNGEKDSVSKFQFEACTKSQQNMSCSPPL